MKTHQCIHMVYDPDGLLRRCRNVAYNGKDECWRHEGKADRFMASRVPVDPTPAPTMAPPHAVSSVNHPTHYNHGRIEAITVIEDWGLNFNLGNAVKYISRADHKGNAIEDLRKALWYIQRELDRRNTVSR